MEALRSWALTVAMAALAGGIVRLLAPKGSVERAVRTVVAVFLLCAFLSPLWNRSGSTLDWILPDEEQTPTLAALDDAVAEQMRTAVEAELQREISETLLLRGVSEGTAQILLETDILSDGSINIVTARAVLPSGTDITGLAAALKSQTGVDVEIIREG